ncbi:MAG: Aromatic/aminoadipate aminotransferase 1 [Chrysothrix sp. TS-e1954]|nr:MAG: Aromatic/aminoadipate aminotransferase 1 [Chrysothrix sp. TS-e1954]
MPPPSADVAVEGVTDTQGFQMPDILTINDIEKLRTKAGKLVAGVAAKADVELFKGRGRHAHKPLAKRWDNRISYESANRQHSSIKAAAQYLSKPGIISLGGGLPSEQYFPFDDFSIKAPAQGHFSEEETLTHGEVLTARKRDQTTGRSLFDIATAFNYGQGSGSPQLLRFFIEHTDIVHNPKYRDWQCTMTIGTTSAVEMVLRMLGHPGMCLLTEEYSFAAVVEAAAALQISSIGVAVDDQGLLPDSLDHILTTWDPKKHNNAPKPYLLYTVPTGQNPTGATQSFQRRKAIYAVAQKHDVLICEDEPYYFLQMQPYTGQDAPDAPPPASLDAFLKALVPSYLSLDTDGRVLRMDSCSKVLAPGARIGWITAPEQLVERYRCHADVGTQGPSGFSQLAVFKLLDEHWGHSGYLEWLIYIRLEYTKRRDVILGACEKYLPREVVSWKPPMAGMFHWLQVDWRKHPLAGKLSVTELEERIWLKAIEDGSLLIKGSWFRADQGTVELGDKEQMFFRTTYAAAPAEKIREAIKRFGNSLREEFGLKSVRNGVVVNGYGSL